VTSEAITAAAAGTWTLGDLTVNRIGFGAMRLTSNADGTPSHRGRAVTVLRRAAELGVNHIDTAAFYFLALRSANELINRALAPFPDGLVITTKVWPGRDPFGEWLWAAPQHLRGQVEENLRQLGRDRAGPAGVDAPARTARAGHPGNREPGGQCGRRRTAAHDGGNDPAWRRRGYSPVSPSTDSRSRSAWPLCRAYSSIMWHTIQRRLRARPSGQVRRAGCSRPPPASALVTRARERATASRQSAWSCSGVSALEHPAQGHRRGGDRRGQAGCVQARAFPGQRRALVIQEAQESVILVGRERRFRATMLVHVQLGHKR
jgi:hypothetical protein